MSLTLITPPAVEPLTLADARTQCRVDADDTSQDSLLQDCIVAAREMAEHELGRCLITQTWRQQLDEFPATSDIKLDIAKPQSIAQLQYLDTAGAWQTLAGSAYVLDAAVGPAGWLYPADGTEWPATKAVANAVRIDIVVGFGATAADVPANVRAWMKLVVAYLYAQREAVDLAGRSTELPGRFHERLLDRYRVYGI